MTLGHANGCTAQGTAVMASPDKQQKRAQRAKAKAKQNRSGKARPSVIHPVLNHAFVNEPFDDVEIDLSTFDS